MLNKKIPTIVFLSLILLNVGAITVERETGSVLPNETIEINITINLEDANPSSMIVTENIPGNWTLISSTPKANDFEGNIKWLLYGNKLKEEITLKYKLKAPIEFEEQKLTGNWQTLEFNGAITGNTKITKAQPEPKPIIEPAITPTKEPEPVEETSIDPILIAAAVIILLLIIIVVVVLKKRK